MELKPASGEEKIGYQALYDYLKKRNRSDLGTAFPLEIVATTEGENVFVGLLEWLEKITRKCTSTDLVHKVSCLCTKIALH